jgi:hypothetical protein
MDSEKADKRADKTDANKKKALEALKSTMGNITAACSAAGVNRQHFYTWRDNDPDFEQEVKNISESAIDMGETALMKQIQDGNTACIIFFLKTRGKERGYVERMEHDHRGKDGGAIQYENIPLEIRIAALEMLENGTKSDPI